MSALAPWSLRERSQVALLLALTAALVLPGLSAGLWDPWETHYAEVAREMIARGDYVYPWWESAWFFSKPALELWACALGLLLGGAASAPGHAPLPRLEGLVRLPFAAAVALGAVLVCVAVGRLWSRRAGFLAGVAVISAPVLALLSRQAVPDPLFVGLLSGCLCCAALALFDEGLSPATRDRWAIAAAALSALATLAKGLLGFALPGAVFLLYGALAGDWPRLLRLRPWSWALVLLALCGPWYGTLLGSDLRDEEGNTFFERFIIHDHFRRLASGVHTTTPGGTFVYFLEQLGFGAFPWVLAFPGALGLLMGRSARPTAPRDRFVVFTFLWALVAFAVVAFSATKFHHYAVPALVPMLMLSALFLDQLLLDGLRPHAPALLLGLCLAALVGHDLVEQPKRLSDLFVYNYDRPYPVATYDPRALLGAAMASALAVGLSPWLFDRAAQLLSILRAACTRVGRARLRLNFLARGEPGWQKPPEPPQDRWVALSALVGLSLFLAGFCGLSAFRALSPHWTQRELYATYATQARPGEPLGAYLMNWRGETFYSQNAVRQLRDLSELRAFLRDPAVRKWILIEQGRVGALRDACGPSQRVLAIDDHSSVKYALVSVAPVGANP